MACLICPDLSSVSLGVAGPVLLSLFQDEGRQSYNGLCLQVLVLVHDDGPQVQATAQLCAQGFLSCDH